MTATLARPSAPRTWTIGAPRLLAGLDRPRNPRPRQRISPCTARCRLPTWAPASHADASGLTGRGGAGFPLAAKLRRTARAGGGRSSSTAARASRPATRTASCCAAPTPGARRRPRGRRGRTAREARHRRSARRRSRGARQPGNRPTHRRGARPRRPCPAALWPARPGRSCAGSEAARRSLLAAATHLTEQGVIVSNVETFAQVAVLLRLGAHRFAETGTHAEPGTTLLTISGAVARPGVVEIPLGTPLGIVLTAAGARASAGRDHRRLPRRLASRRRRCCSPGRHRSGGRTVRRRRAARPGRQHLPLGELARVAATGWPASPRSSADRATSACPRSPRTSQHCAAGHPRRPCHALRHAHLVEGRGACASPRRRRALRHVRACACCIDEVDPHLAHGGCGRPVLGRLSSEVTSMSRLDDRLDPLRRARPVRRSAARPFTWTNGASRSCTTPRPRPRDVRRAAAACPALALYLPLG